MEHIPIMPTRVSNPLPLQKGSSLGATDLTGQFGSFLSDAMTKLKVDQMGVERLNNQFIKGELSIEDAHQLMIASEKAAIGLELTIQLRNKAVEAYQEIMRMQI